MNAFAFGIRNKLGQEADLVFWIFLKGCGVHDDIFSVFSARECGVDTSSRFDKSWVILDGQVIDHDITSATLKSVSFGKKDIIDIKNRSVCMETK